PRELATPTTRPASPDAGSPTTNGEVEAPALDRASDAPAPLGADDRTLPAWVPTGRLLGRFVTTRGEPIRGVLASLHEHVSTAKWSRPEAFATETSDAAGRFIFARVPSGLPLSFHGELPDGRDVEIPAAAVPTGGEVDLGDILVTDGLRLEGL